MNSEREEWGRFLVERGRVRSIWRKREGVDLNGTGIQQCITCYYSLPSLLKKTIRPNFETTFWTSPFEKEFFWNGETQKKIGISLWLKGLHPSLYHRPLQLHPVINCFLFPSWKRQDLVTLCTYSFVMFMIKLCVGLWIIITNAIEASPAADRAEK